MKRLKLLLAFFLCLFLGGVAWAQHAFLFQTGVQDLYATFTAADATTLVNYTPDRGPRLTGSTWTIQSGRAVCNPTLGSELVTNGTFDSNITGWTNRISHLWDTFEWDASGKLHLAGNGDGTPPDYYCYSDDNVALINGALFKSEATVTITSGGPLTINARQSGTAGNNYFILPNQGAYSTSGTQTGYYIGTVTESVVVQNYQPLGFATNALVDNITVKQVSLSSCLATFNGGAVGSGYRFKTAFTSEAGGWKGVAVGLNSASTPTQGLFAYINRTTATAELRVLTAANTWTSLISTATTYSADAELILVYDSKEQKVWLMYNKALIGTAQDVSSYTWLKSNTTHALFSTGQAANEGFTSMDFGPLRLGADLFDAGAGTFASGTYNWTVYGTNTIENDSGQLKVTYVDNSLGAYTYFSGAGDLTTNLTVGAIYRIDGQARVGVGNSVSVAGTGSQTFTAITQTALTNFTSYFIASNATTNSLFMTSMGAGEIIWLDNLTLKAVN